METSNWNDKITIKSDRVYYNNEPTNQYKCDSCGDYVLNLREVGDKQVCSDCENNLDN